VIGRLGAPRGLDGSWRFVPETDFPERLRPGRAVGLRPEGDGPVRWTVLRQVVRAGRGWSVAMRDIASREAALPFQGGLVVVRPADLPPLPPGEYYHHQLVGLTVRRADGRVLGRLERVLQTGANDVFVVRRADGREALIPAVRAAVASMCSEEGEVRLTDLPGLLDDEGGAGG
jgi:16S rRNA processing protein RimM